MSDPYEQLEALQRQLARIRESLSSEEAETFERRVATIAEIARDHPERAEEISAELSRLTSEIPGMADAAQPVTAGSSPVPHQARGASPSASARDPMERTMQTISEPNPTPTASWTPELKLQALKESTTAVLGVVVVLYTLFVAHQTLALVGDQAKMSQAKDILTLLLALAGVIVGYYFGRLPADARATVAAQQATTAVKQAERVKAKAQELADQVSEVTERGPTRGGDMLEDLLALRAKAREISSLATR